LTERRERIVVMAGAGVSAGPPSSLPAWKPLNAAIVGALRRRVEAGLDGRVSLAQAETLLDIARTDDAFPPEYQAQVIEAMCGERYFQGLQALDVHVGNSAHESIASLAQDGMLRAIVTTNFDRLIEQALGRRGVAYDEAFDEAGFLRIRERLQSGATGPLPVIKVHGSVSSPRSMIDTLKQRYLSRSRDLQSCLDMLYPQFWLYLGFSAADLDSNGSYLGMIDGARTSEGATFVAYPLRPELGRGASALMSAYADRGRIVVAEIAEYVGSLRAGAAGVMSSDALRSQSGLEEFHARLQAWAGTLSFSSAGLCLAAILEANGQAEFGVRIMDLLVRKEIYDERDTPDFRLLQLQYGRLGAAYGRFTAVPDLNGVISNASVETEQSLLRLLHTELAFAASSWLACWYLWRNLGQDAMSIAVRTLESFYRTEWREPRPRSDEEAVDAWLAAAQVMVLNTHASAVQSVHQTAPSAAAYARRSGDMIRVARVYAMHLLALAETTEDVPDESRRSDDAFREAIRVSDGVALGFRALALGRWHVGAGGLALASATNDRAGVANRALECLNEASNHFQKQGLDPWLLFTKIQAAKALADLGDLARVHDVFENNAQTLLPRFPILTSHQSEAVAQIEAARNDPDAGKIYEAAIASAEESGLFARRETLGDVLARHRQSQERLA
jgi:SIR2-like domain